MKTFVALSMLVMSAALTYAQNLTITGFEIATADGINICISKDGELLQITAQAGAIKRDGAGRISGVGMATIEYNNDGTIAKIGNNVITRDIAGQISGIGELSIIRGSDGTIKSIGKASILYDNNGTIAGMGGDPRIRPTIGKPRIHQTQSATE